jgi:hypothetical protein
VVFGRETLERSRVTVRKLIEKGDNIQYVRSFLLVVSTTKTYYKVLTRKKYVCILKNVIVLPRRSSAM